MNSSASRREQIPAFEMYLLSRTPPTSEGVSTVKRLAGFLGFGTGTIFFIY